MSQVGAEGRHEDVRRPTRWSGVTSAEPGGRRGPARRGVDEVELTVLMPCLNEAETVATCVHKAIAFLDRAGVAGEVVVSDNGSDDGSVELAETAGARVVRTRRRGYGAALISGIRAARGRYVIMADADDSYDFSRLDAFLERLRGGADLVMGNRFKGGIEPDAMPPLHRYLGNPVLTWIGRLFYRSPVGDFHCGLRGFRRDRVLGLGLASPGMEFASEMVVKATLADLRIAEVPTTLSPDGRSRPPHLRSWRDGWRHLRFLLLFSPSWLFLIPGALLMMAGLLGMAWLTPAPRTFGSVTFDVNTLLYAAGAVVCGFQAFAFGVFAKFFAAREGLLPWDRRLNWLNQPRVLELGLGVGAVLFLAGLAASFYGVGMWSESSFGDLDPRRSIRLVAPAATALMLGTQVGFASFFLAVLRLKEE